MMVKVARVSITRSNRGHSTGCPIRFQIHHYVDHPLPRPVVGITASAGLKTGKPLVFKVPLRSPAV